MKELKNQPRANKIVEGLLGEQIAKPFQPLPKGSQNTKCTLCGRPETVRWRIYGQNKLDGHEEKHYIEFEIPDYSKPGEMEKFFLHMVQNYCTAWNERTNEYTMDMNQLCDLWDIKESEFNEL